MDFFEAQARARKSSSRLVALFALGLLGTIAAGYFATILLLGQLSAFTEEDPTARIQYQRLANQPSATDLWQPGTLLLVTCGTLGVVGLASLYKWTQFSSGGAAVAESVGGRRVDPHTTDLAERRLLNVVEEMAIAASLPVPAVYVLDDEPGLNAFAAGLTTHDAVVAVTRGTLEKLSRDELQGVVGHEFSHVLNGDMRLNLRLAALVFGILVLGLAGRGILWALSQGRFRSGRKEGGVIIAIGAAGLALLVIGYIGYFFGRLIQAAVSRQREFLADASAVQFTRNPAGITGALKKIGGYALGSALTSNRAGAIGHFFFAQGFRSNFGGLWATHPPLEERIRAIEPGFDGRFFEPPKVVDVARESFVTAGLVPPRTQSAPPLLSQADRSSQARPFDAAAAVASVGQLSAADLDNAQELLEQVPTRLRAAARSTADAPPLVCGLVFDSSAAQRPRQRDLVARRLGAEALRTLDTLEPDLKALAPELRLPLLQLSLPALRAIPLTGLAAFFDVLDDLVHWDGRVSTFEFALQKILLRHLATNRAPSAQIAQIYSFQAVSQEISIVLSAVAHAAAADESTAAAAFSAGTSQLKLIAPVLAFLPEEQCDLARLDSALDRLATANGPMKQRTLLAAAHVVSADGMILPTEGELLRAMAAALDCPMPPLSGRS